MGQPDSYAGELPVAFVVLKPGTHTSETELRDFAAARVPEPAACPKLVWILRDMPLTPIGKIFKPALRILATQHAIRSALEAMPHPPAVSDIVVAEGGSSAVVEVAGLDQASETSIRAVLAGMPVTIGIEPG